MGMKDKSKWNAWASPVNEWYANPVDAAGKQPEDMSAAALKERYADLIKDDPVAARQKIVSECDKNHIDWHKGEYKELMDMINDMCMMHTQNNIIAGVSDRY